MENKPDRFPIDTLDDGPKLPPPPPVPPDASLQEQVVAVLQGVYDPEIPVNVHELGLVYGIDVDAEKNVVIRMTLTSPACPVAGSLPPEVEAKVKALPGVASAKVELVWDPPWTPERMSEAARLQLGLF
jgi:FeS assembly SUF system protein